MTWQDDVLEAMHHFIHVSINLAPAGNEFDLSKEYMETRMMVVALVLVFGFSILVLLALFLCLVITFMPALLWPSWFYRMSIVALTLCVVIFASFSMDGTHDLTRGTNRLQEGIGTGHL